MFLSLGRRSRSIQDWIDGVQNCIGTREPTRDGVSTRKWGEGWSKSLTPHPANYIKPEEPHQVVSQCEEDDWVSVPEHPSCTPHIRASHGRQGHWGREGHVLRRC